jgi:hypothetical protein
VSGGGGDDDDDDGGAGAGGAGGGGPGCGPGAGRARASNPEHERHLRLARYHMDMAAQHSNPNSAGPASFPASFPATSSLSQLSLPPCEHESDERVDRVLRAAAHEFWWNPSEIPHRGRRDDDDDDDDDDANPRHQKMLKRERKPRDPSPYNVFIREEIPRLKEKDPGLNHRDAFKAAAKNWAHSPLNMRSPAFVPDRPAERDDDDDDDARRERDMDGDDSAAARAAIMRKLQPILQSTPTRGEEGTEAAAAAAAAGKGDGDRANDARESAADRDEDKTDKTSARDRRGTSSHRTTKSSEHSTECKEYTSW